MNDKRTRLFSGMFRNKMRIEKQVRTPDSYGGFNTAYSIVGDVWCDRQSLSFGERFFQGEMQHTEDFNLVFRRTQSWTLLEREADQLRILYEGSLYRVQNVSNVDARREYVKLRVTKHGATADGLSFPHLFDGVAMFDGLASFSSP